MTDRRIAMLVLILAACGGDGAGGPGGPDGGASGGADAAPLVIARVRDYLRPSPFSELVLEIDAVPGFTPRAGSTAAIRTELARVLDKPAGVTATQTISVASKGADHAWTPAELDQLAASSYDLGTSAQQIKIHVLFVDGHHVEDTSSSKILGVAWGNTHLVMFKKTIEDNCRDALPLLSEQLCEAAEQSIWLHELGHIIGLVDNGLGMVSNHKDAAHGAHDSSTSCVMYWAYEGKGAIDTLITRFTGGNQSALSFDDNCLADLAAGRNSP
jgi:hypothetical protein